MIGLGPGDAFPSLTITPVDAAPLELPGALDGRGGARGMSGVLLDREEALRVREAAGVRDR